VEEGVHAPLPLQTAAVVRALLEQLASLPQGVLDPGKMHDVLFEPSQWPAQLPLPAHAERGVVTATHVPFPLLLAQDSH
jgi:hypothetical protein